MLNSLQVLPLYLQKLANEDWVKQVEMVKWCTNTGQNYYISEFDGTQVRSYDTVLLSKFPAKQLNVYTIHSYMSRRLYVWDTELNKESVRFQYLQIYLQMRLGHLIHSTFGEFGEKYQN